MNARNRSIRMRVSEDERQEIARGSAELIRKEGIDSETQREPGLRDAFLFLLRQYQSQSRAL